MWLNANSRTQEIVANAPSNDAEAFPPVPVPNRRLGRKIMRQMLIAVAIAAGLVALWAMLLPLAA